MNTIAELIQAYPILFLIHFIGMWLTAVVVISHCLIAGCVGIGSKIGNFMHDRVKPIIVVLIISLTLLLWEFSLFVGVLYRVILDILYNIATIKYCGLPTHELCKNIMIDEGHFINPDDGFAHIIWFCDKCGERRIVLSKEFLIIKTDRVVCYNSVRSCKQDDFKKSFWYRFLDARFKE